MKAVMSATWLLVTALWLGAPAQARDQASVDLTDPEHFTDVGAEGGEAGRNDPALLARLQQALERRISERLAPGQKLAIAVTDVDLAGRMEFVGMKDGRWLPTPQQSRNHAVDSPARLELEYALTQNGNVIAHGRATLENRAAEPVTAPYDPLLLQVQMFDRWLAELLPAPAVATR